mmetsp:Transcript_13139/g.19171  ORF Transcript_13139/g.19171 Transcript_13139/m.19171 type:complete len:117 (-) Transcript_13139:29-379(-)
MVKQTLKKVYSEVEKKLGSKARHSKVKTIKKKALEQELRKKKKSKKQKGAFGGLKSLEACLDHIKQESSDFKHLSKKESEMIQNRDTQRFQAVIANQAFQTNPLQALKQHLQINNT